MKSLHKVSIDRTSFFIIIKNDKYMTSLSHYTYFYEVMLSSSSHFFLSENIRAGKEKRLKKKYLVSRKVELWNYSYRPFKIMRGGGDHGLHRRQRL